MLQRFFESPRYIFWPLWTGLFLLCPVITSTFQFPPILAFLFGLIWGAPLGMVAAARLFDFNL